MRIFIDAGDSSLSLQRAEAIIQKNMKIKDEIILWDNIGANQVLKVKLLSLGYKVKFIPKTNIFALDLSLCGYWMKRSNKTIILLNLTSPPIPSINTIFDLALRYAGRDKMKCIFI